MPFCLMSITAITAAVAGVIASLAMFFAYHVFWPGGFGHSIDGFSIALAIGATLAIFRFKAGVIPVILSCGVLGMGWRLLV